MTQNRGLGSANWRFLTTCTGRTLWGFWGQTSGKIIPNQALKLLALTACSEAYFAHEFRCRDRTGHRQTSPRGSLFNWSVGSTPNETANGTGRSRKTPKTASCANFTSGFKWKTKAPPTSRSMNWLQAEKECNRSKRRQRRTNPHLFPSFPSVFKSTIRNPQSAGSALLVVFFVPLMY